jgi:hypothetical protein
MNAAVTSAQTSLQIASIAKTPETNIETRRLGGGRTAKNQLHNFTERSNCRIQFSENINLVKVKKLTVEVDTEPFLARPAMALRIYFGAEQ